MRSRFVIPAALLVGAAYAKGRRNAVPGRGQARAPAPVPSVASAVFPFRSPEVLRAEAEAADAVAIAEAQTVAAAAPVALPEAEPEPVVAVVDESGSFSLGGWATEAGQVALCGVTFRDRRGEAPGTGALRLLVNAESNVAEGGLVVLSDEGFAPDRDGFTILAAADAPGAFAASGRYALVADE